MASEEVAVAQGGSIDCRTGFVHASRKHFASQMSMLTQRATTTSPINIATVYRDGTADRAARAAMAFAMLFGPASAPIRFATSPLPSINRTEAV